MCLWPIGRVGYVARVLKDVGKSFALPGIGDHKPLPGAATRNFIESLYKRLCHYWPDDRMTSFDELISLVDTAIKTARDDEGRKKTSEGEDDTVV